MSSKPDISVRKPPEEDNIDNTEDIEEFIQGEDSEASDSSGTQTSERRRTTIYFDAETAKNLRIYCAAEDRELSEVTSQAVAEFLSNKDFP